MESTLQDKLLRLAFDPAAHEGEAVNAFLMYRRSNGKVPVLSAPKAEKFSSTWTIKVTARTLDAFLGALATWKTKPYYHLSFIQERKKMLDMFHFTLLVEFDTRLEQSQFDTFLDKVFVELKKP